MGKKKIALYALIAAVVFGCVCCAVRVHNTNVMMDKTEMTVKENLEKIGWHQVGERTFTNKAGQVIELSRKGKSITARQVK